MMTTFTEEQRALINLARGDWNKMTDKQKIVKLRTIELALRLMYDREFRKKFIKDGCPNGAMGS